MKNNNKTLEQLIKELEETGIIDVIGDSVSIQDTSYKILFQNQTSKDIIGDHAGEYCYRAYEIRAHICEGCALKLSFDDGKIHIAEKSITTDNGKEYFEIIASPLRDSTGNVIAGIEVARNITKRKQAERDLRVKESAIATSINAIGFTDLQGKLIYVNNSCVKMWGYNTKDEMLGRFLPEFWEGEGVLKTIKLLREQGKATGEDIGKRKDGSLFYVEFTANIIKDEAGNPLYMFGSFVNITERKQMEEALRKAHDEMEIRVIERTKKLAKAEEKLGIRATELEETNTALKVLLKQLENDKKDFEENILSNLKHLILPYVEKLKKRKPKTKEIAYLNVLESNLREIVSPFSQRLSSKYLSLTPQEIKVADLIKDGIRDKEMAEILEISVETVKSHRQNIRKKLGIYSKRANLRTQLLTITK